MAAKDFPTEEGSLGKGTRENFRARMQERGPEDEGFVVVGTALGHRAPLSEFATWYAPHIAH